MQKKISLKKLKRTLLSRYREKVLLLKKMDLNTDLGEIYKKTNCLKARKIKTHLN